jgi:cobalamin biosynthesis Mg chelatase CobN
MSVIALALACSPALAQAECTSSSCVQYTESIPKPDGGNAPTPSQKTPAKASKTGGNGSEPSRPGGSKKTGAEKSEEGEASGKEGVAVPGHNGQGKPGGSAYGGGKQGMQKGGQNAVGTPASHSNGGGSSPLVPILVAIAVLAAISVAVVMIRQRRQRRGPTATASPEAN